MGFLVSLLAGPLGKIVMYIVGGLMLIGTVTGGYFIWKHNVKAQAVQEFNTKQLEQVNKDNQIFKNQMEQILKSQADIVKSVKTQQESIDAQSDSINDYLNTDEAKKSDRPSSELLKETIRRMSK
jgi:disulfide bond formation protein DsbB